MNNSARQRMILFELSRALQSAANNWMRCRHAACQRRKTCTGGPRGTAQKTGGFAACSPEGQERLLMMGDHARTWPQEHAYASASESERTRMRDEKIAVRLAILKAEMAVAKHSGG